MNEQEDDEQFYKHEMLTATEREATVRGIQHGLKASSFWSLILKEMFSSYEVAFKFNSTK